MLVQLIEISKFLEVSLKIPCPFNGLTLNVMAVMMSPPRYFSRHQSLPAETGPENLTRKRKKKRIKEMKNPGQLYLSKEAEKAHI